jgi:hypothetical protein
MNKFQISMILRIALLIPILSVCSAVFAVDFSYFDKDPPLKNSSAPSLHHKNLKYIYHILCVNSAHF